MILKHFPQLIKKILIVNRSEIAVRIQCLCRALDIKVVVVYTSDDVCLRYVRDADEAYELSGRGFAAYMNQDEIITIATTAGVDAIHPGYGFLSENAQFARKVFAAGFIWIGPDPETILIMGDKIKARALAESIGIPVVPGLYIQRDACDYLLQIHNESTGLGYPIIIKDPRAGGGKAMRKVDDSSDLEAALVTVVSESIRMTDSRELLIEKYLEHGRHIEVQIAGDGERAIHLFERECSIQRRHQKIIEEAPCLFVKNAILNQMYDAAIALARAVKYKSVGTVEFMVTPDDKFYFLEMNTRLQVEHSVTEMTTGVDLVALQIDVAQNGVLSYQQSDIICKGHAIECRVYAEDPAHNFSPSTGVITYLQLPCAPWLRHDHDLEEQQEITPLFDPMIAKVTTYGPTRAVALGYMRDVLRQYMIGGISTNISFLQHLLISDEFKSGLFDTQTLKNPLFIAQLAVQSLSSQDDEVIAALAVALSQKLPQIQSKKDTSLANKTSPEGNVSFWKGQRWK